METCGYADADTFSHVTSLCDFVYMDLKLANREQHIRYTGVDNARILENASLLQASGIPHAFRTPLIPGITDTQDNLDAIRAIVGDSSWEQLAYNPLAGAKYGSVGKEYPLTLL
jgi:pyruvate formate lyase activating enzyme